MGASAKPRLLWIVPKWPLPANDGARRATVSLLSAVSRAGLEIELLVILTQPADELPDPCPTLGVSRVHCLTVTAPFTRRLLRLAWHAIMRPLAPVTVAPYLSPKLAMSVRKILSDSQASQPFTHIVLDGLHAAAWLCHHPSPADSTPLPKLLYRAHNCETTLWRTSARERGGLWGILLGFQAFLMSRFEQRILKICNLVLPVSDADSAKLKALASGVSYTTLPIGLDFHQAELPLPAANNLTLLFIGKLDWPPNRQGLEWFLREVWPQLIARRSDLCLIVAGSGYSDLKARFVGLQNVIFIGEVADVKEAYARAHAALIPIFSGSGTRVKAIEAACFKRAIIGTALGVEGLNLDPNSDFSCAETAEQWISTIASLQKEQVTNLGQRVFSKLAKTFDERAVGAKFLSMLS